MLFRSLKKFCVAKALTLGIFDLASFGEPKHSENRDMTGKIAKKNTRKENVEKDIWRLIQYI